MASAGCRRSDDAHTAPVSLVVSHPMCFVSQQGVVQFSPGPIRAEDGDKGINAPLTFSILSGQILCWKCWLFEKLLIRFAHRFASAETRSAEANINLRQSISVKL